MALSGRTVYLGFVESRELRPSANALALTPNRLAAQALRAPALSLERYAADLLRRAGFPTVPPVLAQRYLRDAVSQVIPTEDVEGTARAFRPTLSALFRADANLDLLTDGESRRARELGLVARAYRDRLRSERLVDSAETLARAAELPLARRALLVYGYPRLGHDELRLVDAAAGEGSAIYLPDFADPVFEENRDAARFLESRGWTIRREEGVPDDVGARLATAFLGAPSVGGAVRAYAYDNAEAEVRGTLAQVKALLVEGTPPHEIAVIARDDAACGPLALAIAWEHGLPLRALYAIPLSQTRLGAWLRLALDVAATDFPYDETLRLVTDPFGPGLDAATWSEVRRARPRGLSAWKETGVDLTDLTWPTRETRGGYVRQLRAMFQRLDLRRTAFPWPREMLVWNTLVESLDELERPPTEVLSFNAFVRDVRDALDALTVPAAPGRAGVELHTPLSLYGARYRHIFVMGLAEGIFPRPVQDDPVLDFHERRRLSALGIALELPVGAARREKLTFVATLLATAERLTVSYSRLIGNQKGEPSAFFQALGVGATTPPSVVASLEEKRRVRLRPVYDGGGENDRAEARDGMDEGGVEAFAAGSDNLRLKPRLDGHDLDPVLEPASHAWQVELRREGSEPPDEYDGCIGEAVPLDGRRFSASQLLAIGQCPFKWFAGYALRLAEADEATTTLAPDQRGNLYHRALQLGLARVNGASDVREGLLACLDEAFAEAERDVGVLAIPAWSAQRDGHLRVLRQAIRGEDFLRPDAKVIRTESRFDGEWRGLRVSGLVDRIDRGADGLILVDYKTRSSRPDGAQDRQGKLTLDVQLPLYREVAALRLYPSEPVAEAYYYSLTKAESLGSGKGDDAALAELAERVRGHFRDGSFPVWPDVEQKACTYCVFDPVCRHGPRLERKRAAAQ